jgi:hypothetical protein
MKRLIGWLLVVLVLAGVVVIGPIVCDIDWTSVFRSRASNRLAVETFRKIVNGMNRQDVTAILGAPSEDHMGSLAGSGTLEDGSRFLVWSDGRTEVTVHFNPEGLVISKTSKPLPP